MIYSTGMVSFISQILGLTLCGLSAMLELVGFLALGSILGIMTFVLHLGCCGWRSKFRQDECFRNDCTS